MFLKVFNFMRGQSQNSVPQLFDFSLHEIDLINRFSRNNGILIFFKLFSIDPLSL